MKKLTKLLANRRLPGEHSLHRRAAARHAAINNREPDITEVRLFRNGAVMLWFNFHVGIASVIHLFGVGK